MVAKTRPTRRFVTPLREVVAVPKNVRRAVDWRWGYGWWRYWDDSWRNAYNTSWIVPCDMRGER